MNLNVADFESILAFSKQQPAYLNKLYEAFYLVRLRLS